MIKVVARDQQHSRLLGQTARRCLLLTHCLLRSLGDAAGGRLLDVRLEVVQRSGAGVLIDAFAIDDPQQRRVALHIVVDADGPMLGAVDLRNRDGCVVLEGDGQLIPGGSETLLVERNGCIKKNM